jgi:hypothetical protein
VTTDPVDPVDPADRHAELAEELAGVGAARAELTALKVAWTTGGHRDIVRDRLDALIEGLVGAMPSPESASQSGFPSAETGTGALLLAITVDRYRSDISTRKRPTAEVITASVARHAAAARRLPASDSRLRMLHERVLINRGGDRELLDDAIADLTQSLRERGYEPPVAQPPSARGRGKSPAPQQMNFVTSLHALSLGSLHRRRGGNADQALASAIIDETAAWRTDRYGSQHPFTLVAEGHRVLAALAPLERALDTRPLTADETATALHVGDLAHRLEVARAGVLGARHMATVRALSYQARALRLSEDPVAASSAAERALAAAESAQAKKYHELPPIMKVIVAEACALGSMQAKSSAVELGHAHARYARSPQHADQAAQIRSTIEAERERAGEERRRALRLLDEAEEALEHQRSVALWLTRLRVLRTRLVSGSLPPWLGGPPLD